VLDAARPHRPPGAGGSSSTTGSQGRSRWKESEVLLETHDSDEVVARVATLAIGKAELVCCSRIPSPDRRGQRLQEVVTYSTMTRSLHGMADRLIGLGVTRVVMEATSDYWKPAFYLLEAAGFEVWLVNAKDVKHLPGRPKTDRLDAVWLCKVPERQMVRPSYVPPKPIRRLRDLTRYRPRWSPRPARRRTGSRSYSRTPRSSCPSSPRTSSGSPAGT
jgi:hypothetical protein